MQSLTFADRRNVYAAINPDGLDEIAKHPWWSWCGNPKCVVLWDNRAGQFRRSMGYVFMVFKQDFPTYANKLRIPGIYYQTNGDTKLMYTGSPGAIMSVFKRFCATVKPGDPPGWAFNRPNTSQGMWD